MSYFDRDDDNDSDECETIYGGAEEDEEEQEAEARADDDDDEEEEEEPEARVRAIARADGDDEEEEDILLKKRSVGEIYEKKKVNFGLDYQNTYDYDDDEYEENLQKFELSVNENYIFDFHPESIAQSYDDIIALSKVERDHRGKIVDPFHKTIPFLTKYERARILGQRAKQINSGSGLFITKPKYVMDGYLLAELELKAKNLPFIIRRPLPGGGSEYWRIEDLEDVMFDF
jgi:DNA-directed RNA polymerase I, II, and III subunit RPABC2